jgi:hypothetical protein
MKPFVHGGSYYPSRVWTPFVRGNGWTTQDGGEEQGVPKTVSGSLLRITDALAGDVSALSVAINPVQSGSGDPAPDNVRPISGWTQVKVTRTGKNLLPKMVAGTYTNNGGTIVVDENGVATMSGTTTATGNVATIPLSTPLVITQEMVDAGLYYHINNSDANAVIAANLESSGGVSAASLAFTPVNRISGAFGAASVGKRIDRVRFWISSGVTLSGTYAPSFEFSSAASDYEPYSGTTLTIDLDGTIYGGTLDVLTGVLTVNKGIVDLGSLSWEKFNGTQTAYFRASVPGIKPAASSLIPDGISCSAYQPTGSTYVSYSAYPYSIGVTSTQTANYIYVQDLRWNNADDFKTNASGVMFVYPLKNPQTYQLTPTEVSTLLGANNIWADTGDTTMTYMAQEA